MRPRRCAPRRGRNVRRVGRAAATPLRSMPRAGRHGGWSRMPGPPLPRRSARAPKRRLHLRRDRGQRAGAVAWPAAGIRRPVERLLVSAIEHASVLAGGRFPADKIGRIPVTRSGVVDLDRLRALLADGPPAWCRSCWPTTRPARSSRSRRWPDRPRSRRPPACRRGPGARENSVRYQCTRRGSCDVFCTQDRRPQRRRRLVVAEGMNGLEPLLRGGGQELSRRPEPRMLPELPASARR